METLEQIAPTYFIEIAADETTREIGVPAHDVTVIKWATEFSRRLVAELANQQEPVGPTEKHVAMSMWLEQFESRIATKRERVFCQTAFSSGWDAAQIAAPTPQDAKDGARYRNIRNKIFKEDIDVGEAYLTLRVVGACPSIEQFDAAMAAEGEKK